MKHVLQATAAAVLLVLSTPAAVLADSTLHGASVESLLALAKERNPDYAAMRHEVNAAVASKVLHRPGCRCDRSQASCRKKWKECGLIFW